jgi:hypothetical protein
MQDKQDKQEMPKVKKTRKRKPKAPVDQETAQKKRREALDKNKQAAAKCRARKKIEEGQKQERLQTLKRENQLLHAVLFQLEDQLKSAKIEIVRHGDCDDPAIIKAKNLITAIELNCHRLNEERKLIRERMGNSITSSEGDDMLDGSGDSPPLYNGLDSAGWENMSMLGSRAGSEMLTGEMPFDYSVESGNWEAMELDSSEARFEQTEMVTNFESEEKTANATSSGQWLEEGKSVDVRDSSASSEDSGLYNHNSESSHTSYELQSHDGLDSVRHEYPSPPLLPALSDDKGRTSSEDSSLNTLFISDASTEKLPTVESKISINRLPSSNFMNVEPRIQGDSICPEVLSPTHPEFDYDMPSFDPLDPIHATFDPSLTLFDEFDFEIQPEVEIKAPEIVVPFQKQRTGRHSSHESPLPTKISVPDWESAKLKRPRITEDFRRDSAIGPEVPEIQLLKDLQTKQSPGFGVDEERKIKSSLHERRSRRLANK